MTDFGTRLQRLPADTLVALAFFSRVPVRPPDASFDLRRSAAAWPIAGLVLALAPAALFWLLRAVEFPATVAALFTLALLALLTGAMHEDGLADTVDGLGGGRTRDDKLALMRDSRLGTFGGLALVFTVLVKTSALAAMGLYAAEGALALLGAAVISRSMALWHWNATMPARREGMAWSAGRPDWMAFAFAMALAAIAALILVVAFGFAAIIGLLLAAAAVGILSSLCEKQIGGHTGDTIGASQQIAETLLLAGLSSGPLAFIA